MKKLILVFAITMVSTFAYSNTSKYTLDDSKVESIFDNSVAVDLDFNNPAIVGVESIQADEKNVWVAVALDIVLGGFGAHRVYLGTPPGIIAGYFFTCGGIFGVLPLIDLIVLIIDNEDISAYINKKGLIMFN